MLKLQVIIGTTRAGRNADPVLRWAMPIIKARDAFQVETLDLREWLLPFFQETIATVGDFANPTYSDPIVKRLQHAHHRALDARLAQLDVTLVQWNALREIARNPGASQHQIAERTFNSDQAFGTLMTRLEVRGLVERAPGAGRVNVACLTRKGASLLRDGQAIFNEVITGSFASLKKTERTELSRLLTKVLAEGDASLRKANNS